MRHQKRKILLFMDNASSHGHLKLKNIKLQFFPANTTSKLQPMDQGIIQATKLKYRKRQLRKTIVAMEKDKAIYASQLLKEVDVLQAIYWIKQAWDDVKAGTIQKCFKNCGFKKQTLEDGKFLCVELKVLLRKKLSRIKCLRIFREVKLLRFWQKIAKSREFLS